ncbi:autotransporter outer membrane beta-barrel domain-containing protein [Bradyrhizobium sp.]|uniref:autotransporter outer membrane beta-barrel domain-containing protein n=1 Tax=Bradyrhizobium sp. TaxID=376 RepID=UPI002DFEC3F6|nr:autotransporter domain-containing protein [Bradyrhizobium sp.]
MAAALDIVVTNTNDSGTGSLRAAIAATNGSADSTNNILFADNLAGKLTLLSDLSITKPVSIDFRTTGAQVIVRGDAGIGIGTSGIATLNIVHEYTGNTTLTAGTLMAGGPSHGLNFGLFGSTNSLLAMSSGSTFVVPGNTEADFQNISGAGTIVNSGGLALFGSTSPATRTFSGTISGSGALTMFGGRETLILSGSTTYSGPTTISGNADFFFAPSSPFAELRAGATSAFSPNSDFLLLGNATLNLNNFNQTIGSLTGGSISGTQPKVLLGSATLTTGGTNSNGTFAGAVTGTGGIIKTGTGTLTLTGANTYSGGTVISAGTLQLGNGGATGSVLGDIRNNGTFAFNWSDTYRFDGLISGSGVLRQNGTGTLALSRRSTYSGGTVLSAGTIRIDGISTLGCTTPSSCTFESSPLGTGALTLNGGTLQQGGNFTFFNAIDIAAPGGKVDLNDFNFFHRGNIADTAGSSNGALTLVNSAQHGFRTLTLTGNNTYSGPTSIGSQVYLIADSPTALSPSSAYTIDAGGVLQINNNNSIKSLSGAGVVLGAAKATLMIAPRAGDTATFSGAVTDTPGSPLSLTKAGDGTQILSGISTYTGATNVNAGTLSVNGSIASSPLTTVNAGATLGGNGTVGNTTINGGTLAPGNSIGTLTVQGNLVFTAAASYMVEVSPANADRTNVTGTATLGGATVKASFAPGTYVSRQYTILNAAGGVSGTFNTLANTDLPANFTSSLSYDSNNAYLNLALNFIPPPGSGLNANQQSAANAIVGFFNSNAGIPLVFGRLTPAGLTQISGEVATGTQQTTFNAMHQFMGLITDPFIAGRGDPVTSTNTTPQFADETDPASAYASDGKPRSKSERDAYAAVYRKAPVMADPFTQRWSVWAAGYGGSQTSDGNAVLGSNNTRSSIGGVAVGADYRFSPYTMAGFALAGGATNFSVNGLGSGRSDLFQAGAFVRHNAGAAYLTGALAYGWQDITTDRAVTIAGTDLLRAQFNANAFSGRAEGGYRLLTPWLGGIGITPYAAAQFVTFDLPAYGEQAIAGANTFALSYNSKNVTDNRSELGIRTDKSYPIQNGILTLRGRVAWAHDFNPDRNIAATFQTLPGASFVVNGAAQASDSALVTGSVEMKWLNGFSLAGTFEGEFSGVTRSYAGKGVVRYAW